MDSSTLSIYSHKEDITFFWRRRGGSNKKNIPHDKWCQTVKLEPEVISMSYVPISSLLNGIHGSGFLSYAINLYLRYKPPLEVLYQFLDTQMPRQWAPVFGEHPLSLVKRHQTDACLQFSFLGPKLYVNNSVVDVVKTPITGARLFLEGKRYNQLAIHLQHLSSCPERFQLQYESAYESSNCLDSKFYEKIRWKMFSHVCTEPVESDDDCCIVTGARFDVKKSGLKSVLFLRLYFSRINDAIVLRKPEWDDSFSSSGAEKSMLSSFASLITGKKKHTEPAAGIDINSALYPGGPPGPVPSALFQYLDFVDTKDITRGAEHTPGFWLMSGARLVVVKGKISLSVKYSLLDIDSSDEENTRLLNVTDLELDSFRSCEEMSL